MANKAYNAIYEVQFRKLELMTQQLHSSGAIKTAIDELEFPATVETHIDPGIEAALKGAVFQLAAIRESVVALGGGPAPSPHWPDNLSSAAAYVLVWLAQLRAQVLLDTSIPITVDTTNSKLTGLRNEDYAESRYLRALSLLDAHGELAREFKLLAADVDPQKVTNETLGDELQARLFVLLRLEWRILTEVTEDLPEGFEPPPQLTSSRRGAARTRSRS